MHWQELRDSQWATRAVASHAPPGDRSRTEDPGRSLLASLLWWLLGQGLGSFWGWFLPTWDKGPVMEGGRGRREFPIAVNDHGIWKWWQQSFGGKGTQGMLLPSVFPAAHPTPLKLCMECSACFLF